MFALVALSLGAYKVSVSDTASARYATIVSTLATALQILLLFYNKYYLGLLCDSFLTALTSTAAVSIRPQPEFPLIQALAAFLYLSFATSLALVVLDFVEVNQHTDDEEDSAVQGQSHTLSEEEKSVDSGFGSRSESTIYKPEDHVWANPRFPHSSPD